MITCYFEDDNKASLRHVVADVIVLKDDKILLGKRSEKIIEGGKWGLIGGYMERDETISEGASREVLEETGWTIKDLTLIDINDQPERDHEDRQNICFAFYCTANQEVSKPDWENTELKWFDLNDLPPDELIAFDHLKTINKYRQQISSGAAQLPLFRSKV